MRREALWLFLWAAGAALLFPARADGEQASALSRTNLMEFVDRRGRIRPVKSRRDWEKRRGMIRAAMEEVMGPFPGGKKCSLDVAVESETDCGEFVRRFLTYQSEPGSRVPAYLLIPKRLLTEGGRGPGVLCLHQTHAQGQKVVVGLGSSPDDEYGVELARRGFVCLAPAYPLLANYHPDLKGLGYISGTMKAIWDNHRGLDLLETLPFVRRGRFGAIGHSLGGHNSVYTAVFDDRIRVVISSCGLDSYRDYMNGDIRGWTSPRYMPRLLGYSLEALPFDFHEVIGALAPRPCLISAPMGDTNFKWESVDRIAAAARPVYGFYGSERRLKVEHPDCGHLFPADMRRKAYILLEESLK